MAFHLGDLLNRLRLEAATEEDLSNNNILVPENPIGFLNPKDQVISAAVQDAIRSGKKSTGVQVEATSVVPIKLPKIGSNQDQTDQVSNLQDAESTENKEASSTGNVPSLEDHPMSLVKEVASAKDQGILSTDESAVAQPNDDQPMPFVKEVAANEREQSPVTAQGVAIVEGVDVDYIGEDALGPDVKIPSTTLVSEGFRQIRVFKSESAKERESDLDWYQRSSEGCKKEFEDLLQGPDFDFSEAILFLSRKYNVTTGKWLVAVPWSMTDNIWKKLNEAFVKGELSDEVRFIKVWARNDLNQGLEGFAMISIATMDWTNKKATLDLGKQICNAGVSGHLKYKPDIVSILGIYRNNNLGLVPTVYQIFNKKRTISSRYRDRKDSADQ